MNDAKFYLTKKEISHLLECDRCVCGHLVIFHCDYDSGDCQIYDCDCDAFKEKRG